MINTFWKVSGKFSKPVSGPAYRECPASAGSGCSWPMPASCECSASCSGGWGRWWPDRPRPRPRPSRTGGSDPAAAAWGRWPGSPTMMCDTKTNTGSTVLIGVDCMTLISMLWLLSDTFSSMLSEFSRNMKIDYSRQTWIERTSISWAPVGAKYVRLLGDHSQRIISRLTNRWNFSYLWFKSKNPGGVEKSRLLEDGRGPWIESIIQTSLCKLRRPVGNMDRTGFCDSEHHQRTVTICQPWKLRMLSGWLYDIWGLMITSMTRVK